MENLNKKLSGELPVTIDELLEIVSSWGRSDSFITDNFTTIRKCEPNRKYPLGNLDVSKITDLSYVFYRSPYNGDLSKWNLSNCKNINRMFAFSEFNNDSLKNWDVSNVEDISYMFFQSYFNGDISNWNTSNIKYLEKTFAYSDFDGDLSKFDLSKILVASDVFDNNKNFQKKYNDEMSLPRQTRYFLDWFENNRFKMKELNPSKEDVLDFFSFDNLEKEIMK